MNILFKDEKDNVYYIEKDCLKVDIPKLGITRNIGMISSNLTTGKSNLTVHRKSTQKWKLGYMISAAPFEHMDFNRLTLIEDDRNMYVLDWDTVSKVWKSWTFKPDNGMEKMLIIPQAVWSEVKLDF